MSSRIQLVLATLLLAAGFHAATILLFPYAMVRAGTGKLLDSHAAVNEIIFLDRITAEWRDVVRPNSEAAYSACIFDVSKSDLDLFLPASDNYASLSLYAANSDNFFVVNDRDVPAEGRRVRLQRSELSGPAHAGGVSLVQSPSDTGLAIYRTIVPDSSEWDAIDRWRREQYCRPIPGIQSFQR